MDLMLLIFLISLLLLIISIIVLIILRKKQNEYSNAQYAFTLLIGFLTLLVTAGFTQLYFKDIYYFFVRSEILRWIMIFLLLAAAIGMGFFIYAARRYLIKEQCFSPAFATILCILITIGVYFIPLAIYLPSLAD